MQHVGHGQTQCDPQEEQRAVEAGGQGERQGAGEAGIDLVEQELIVAAKRLNVGRPHQTEEARHAHDFPDHLLVTDGAAFIGHSSLGLDALPHHDAVYFALQVRQEIRGILRTIHILLDQRVRHALQIHWEIVGVGDFVAVQA